jgi:hypothetical protein
MKHFKDIVKKCPAIASGRWYLFAIKMSCNPGVCNRGLPFKEFVFKNTDNQTFTFRIYLALEHSTCVNA